jgi:hypothetical protein
MIISSNSLLRRPPVSIHPEQVIIFNTIRYCADICEIAFNRLEKNLFDFTYNPQNGEFIALIFSDAWSIINKGALIKKILVSNFAIPFNDPNFRSLSSLKELRDTNQHLEERASQIFEFPDLPPVFGTISWLAKQNGNDDNGILSTIYSGTVFRDITATLENPAGKANSLKVNDIRSSGIARKGRTDDYFEKSIYLNHVLDDIAHIIRDLEIQIEKQFKNIDTSNRHISDLILQLKIREIEIN